MTRQRTALRRLARCAPPVTVNGFTMLDITRMVLASESPDVLMRLTGTSDVESALRVCAAMAERMVTEADRRRDGQAMDPDGGSR